MQASPVRLRRNPIHPRTHVRGFAKVALKTYVWGILIGLLGLPVLSSTAQAETLKWRQGLSVTKRESTPVGNMPSLVVGTGESRGVAFFENGEVAVTLNKFIFFYSNGSGPAESFGIFTFEDGSTFVINFPVIATANERDKTTVFKGEFTFIYGSGRFAGIKGSGSVSGKRFAPLGSGSSLNFDFTGTYTLASATP